MLKKNAPRKLVVRKQTIRELSPTELGAVQGGGSRDCESGGVSSYKVNSRFYPCNNA